MKFLNKLRRNFKTSIFSFFKINTNNSKNTQIFRDFSSSKDSLFTIEKRSLKRAKNNVYSYCKNIIEANLYKIISKVFSSKNASYVTGLLIVTSVVSMVLVDTKFSQNAFAAAPTIAETKSGVTTVGVTATSITTSANLSGVTNDLYLASISTKSVAVSNVTGLGLTWTLVKAQCGYRGQTRIEVWMAQGSASTGNVTATTATSVHIALSVARITGVSASLSLSNFTSANNGGTGTCNGSTTDINTYSYTTLSTTAANSLVFVSTAIRERTHTAGTNWTERSEIGVINAGEGAGLATESQSFTNITSNLTASGNLSSAADWSSVAIEIPEPINIPNLNQTAYRFYANANSTDVGSTVAALNTSATLTNTSDAFRLRMLLKVTTATMTTGSQSFKLQYAGKSGTCDTSFSGESYSDVTTSTPISYYNNSSPTDGATLITNTNDPTDSGATIRSQTYEEANNFTNLVTSIAVNEEGLWDFALYDNSAPAATSYCLRAVNSDGTTFGTYTAIPEIITSTLLVTQATIDSTALVTSGGVYNNNTAPNTVFTSDNVGYTFYIDSDNTAVYRKTSNGGGTWGSAVVVDSQTDVTHVAVWYDRWTPGDYTGTSIYIMTGDSGNNDLWYNKLESAGDILEKTSSPVAISSSPGPAKSNTITGLTNSFNITKSTTGVLFASLADAGNPWVLKCTTTCGIASNWSDTNFPFADFTSTDGQAIYTLPQPGGDIMLIYSDSSINRWASKIYHPSTSAWDTSWNIIKSGISINGTYRWGFSAIVDRTTFKVYFSAANDTGVLGGNNDDIIAVTYDPATLVWTTKTNVITNINTAGITIARLAQDENTGDIYSVYSYQTTAGTANTANIYYKKSTDGMTTWGSQSAAINTTANDIYALRVNVTNKERLYATWWTPSQILGNTIIDLVPSQTTIDLSAYRFFSNVNSTDVGTALAAQDTVATSPNDGSPFKVRVLLGIDGSVNLPSSGLNFKLQYAYKGSLTCDSPNEAYRDITTSSPISYYNNATSTDGTALTTNINDPLRAGHAVRAQTYEEANSFTNSQSLISITEDGLWDFPLYDNGGVAGGTYCLRVIKSTDTLLNSYTTYPQITLATTYVYNQSAYRVYRNLDSADPGSVRSLPSSTSLTFTPAKMAYDSVNQYIYAVGSDQEGGATNGQIRIEKRNAIDGSFVTAFNSQGWASYLGDANGNAAVSIAIDTVGGSMYVGGYTSTAGAGDKEWHLQKRSLTNASLDPTFGSATGIITENVTVGQDDRITDVALDVAGGYVYIVGYDSGGTSSSKRWRIEKRLMTTGALVTAFNTTGILTSDPNSTNDDIPNSIALDTSGGYMFVAGYDINADSSQELRIEKRSLTSGALDTGFNSTGIIASNPSSSTDSFNVIKLDIGGGFLYAGGLDSASGAGQWRIEKRLITTGAVVSAFGASGILQVNRTSGYDQIKDLELDPANGYVYIAASDNGSTRWGIAKIKSVDGTSVINFGTSGSVLYNPTSGTDEPYSIALDLTKNVVHLLGTDIIGSYQSFTYLTLSSSDGTPTFAAQDTPVILPSANQTFQVRMLIKNDIGSTTQMGINGHSFKLQYVGKGTGTCSAPTGGTPALYTDVTASTAIAFKNNPTPPDGANFSDSSTQFITTSTYGPTNNTDTIVNQTYEEQNNFTNSMAAIQVGQNGNWSFALKDLSAPAGTVYCLRAVKSDGTTLNTYSSYPQITSSFAQNIVDSTISTTATVHSGNQGRATVFISDQIGYAFYADSAGTCVYSKSTDGGVNWGAGITVDFQTDCADINVWYDRWTPGNNAGKIIHIATMDTGSSALWYNSLDTNTDTLLAGSSPTNISGTNTSSYTSANNRLSVTEATDGKIYIGSADSVNSKIRVCAATCATGANWSAAGTLPLSNSNDEILMQPLSSGNLMLIRWNRASDIIEYKTYTLSNTTWSGSWTSIATGADDNTTYIAALSAIVNKTTNDIYLAFVDDASTLGTNDDILTYTYNGSAWTANTNVITNESKGITGVSLFRDLVNGDIYAAYSKQSTPGTANTGNVYYKKTSDNMVTWESIETGPINATAGDIRSVQLNAMSDERVFVSWGDSTANSIYGKTITDLNPTWYNPSWLYRKKIVIDKSKISSSATITNFPALINLTSDAQVSAHALSTGNDILFTSEDGTTKLNHEIEKYTTGTGALTGWVKIPTLVTTKDTILYMYYGNSGASSQQNPAAVWDSNYKAVYHMKETPTGSTSDIGDSTGTNNATSSNMVSGDQVTGKIGGALNFDGSNNLVNTGYNTTQTSYTFEAWSNWSSCGGSSLGRIFAKHSTSQTMALYCDNIAGANVINFQRAWSGGSAEWYIPSVNTIAPFGSAFHIAVTYNDIAGQAPIIYINGVAQTLTTLTNSSGTVTNNTDSYYIGNRSAADRAWDGYIDEFRISNAVRTAGWIITQYNNQNSPSTFYALSPEIGYYFPNTNQSPTSVTTLLQKKVTGGTTLTTGTWTSEDQIQFTGVASDPDSSDTLSLCIEKKALGVSFTNTEDSCGSAVAFSGTNIAINATLTGISNNSYHWQARTRDSAGAYSAWVSYDVNAESALDFGVDTVAPTTSGTIVYDAPNGTTTLYATDTFTRTSSSTWGSPETGGAYTTIGGTSSDFNVSSNAGTIANSNVSVARSAYFGSANAQDVDTKFKVSTNKLAIGANQETSLTIRGDGTGQNEYRAKLIFTTAQIVQLELTKDISGTETSISAPSTVSGLTHAAGTVFWLRLQASGTNPTTLNIRTWADGTTEPTTWDISTTDSTSLLQKSGAIGLRSKLLSSTSNLPVISTFDNFYSSAIETSHSGDGSLSVLSANWSPFNAEVSELSKYEYSVGTTQGSTDIKTWTDNGTSNSVSSTGLTLQTGQRYYFNVRSFDNAGNQSSIVSSTGQSVDTTLTFGISSNAVTFDSLSNGNNNIDTKTATVTTSTNAYNGYVIKAYRTGPLTRGSSTIPDFGAGTYASPASWDSSQCTNSGCGFGYTTSDTTIAGINKFNTGTLFAPFATSGPGDVVADHTATISGTPVNSEGFTMTTKVAVPVNQAAGTYTTTIVYTVVPQY